VRGGPAPPPPSERASQITIAVTRARLLVDRLDDIDVSAVAGLRLPPPHPMNESRKLA
jgi:hypothetical protein